jgi:RNA polymerase sigma factor (sigma-70 family)
MEKDDYVANDDLELWENLRQGNQKAFSALFVRFYDDLYAYSLKLTKEEELSKDIIQELFFNLWLSYPKLKQVEILKPYLLKCTKNLIIDYKRRLSTQQKCSLNLIQEDIVFSQEDFRINMEEKSVQTEKLLSILNTLPNRVRETLYLHFFNGLSYPEIALVMDINAQTARNFVHRGIRQMKDLYLLFFLVVSYQI